MLGDAVMVAPPLTSNYTYSVYFPKGKWCNINKMDEVIDSKGENIEIKRAYSANVYLREGYIIPY